MWKAVDAPALDLFVPPHRFAGWTRNSVVSSFFFLTCGKDHASTNYGLVHVDSDGKAFSVLGPQI